MNNKRKRQRKKLPKGKRIKKRLDQTREGIKKETDKNGFKKKGINKGGKRIKSDGKNSGRKWEKLGGNYFCSLQ